MVSCNPMKYLLLTFLWSNALSACHAQSENTSQPEVTIPQGTLLGTTRTTIHDRNVLAFLGIPYAQPPTGNLRFANPVAATGWNGTRDASIDANKCPQSSEGDEDCLYLNVYTPELVQSSNASLLPVMVFIHGGGFTSVSSVSLSFGPEYLLDEDILLVTFNYRLGALGFLSTGDEVASGNWGFKDQVLALKWIQSNIEYFGGDPLQVTLFGQSAGALSVHLLSLSNATTGLFHRYITQSGSILAITVYRPRAAYARRAFELGEYVNCFNDTTESLIACLRNVTPSDIVAMDSRFSVWNSYPRIIWGPTDEPDIEGAFLTDSPANLFAAGQIRDLPWICGVTRDEGLTYTGELYNNETIFNELLDNFDSLLPIFLSYTYLPDGGAARTKAIKSYYFNNDLTTNKSLLLANLTQVNGDSQFNYPAYNALQQQFALARNPQYFYRFNYRGKYSFTDFAAGSLGDYGVSHTDDILYLFPTQDLFAGINETKSETDWVMVDTMVKLWTSFAITGTPSISSLNDTVWEPYSITADNYLQIGDGSDPTLEVQYSFLKERMEFWASLDDITDSSNTTANDSGSATSTPNVLFVLLVIGSEYLLSIAAIGIFE